MTGSSARLRPEGQSDLLARVRRGEGDAREHIVALNSPLVWGIVRRFARAGHEPEDLFQVGCIGLWKAIEKFDETMGTQLSTYAVPLIIGEIRRYLRDQSPVKVSRGAKELARRAWAKQDEMAASSGRDPTAKEVAGELGIPPEDLVAAWEALRHPAPLVGDGEGPDLLDVLEDASESEADWALGVTLKETLERLEPREKMVLVLRYMKDYTQEEVARALGISQAQVSRIESMARRKARDLLSE